MKLKKSEFFAYGCGDFAQQFGNFFVLSYFMFYMTDVAGIPALATGTMYMIVRVWDAINDPIMGRVVDMTRTDRGTAHPWIKRGIPLMAFFLIFMFAIPVKASVTLKIIWAMIGYVGWDFAFTMYLIPYGTLPNMMTDNSEERVLLGTFRDYGANLCGLLVSFGATALIGLYASKGMGTGYTATAVTLAVFFLIFSTIMYRGTHEHIALPPIEKGEENSLKSSLKSLVKNRPAIALTIMMFFWMSFYEFRMIWTAYHCTYYLQNEGLIALLLGAMTAMPLIVEPFVPKLTKVFSKKGMLFLSCSLISVGGILYLIGRQSIVMNVIATCVLGASAGTIGPILWGTLPDAADYGEWKTGVANPGIIYSANSFAQKFSGSLATFISGIVLTAIHYDGTAMVQAATVAPGMYWFNGIINIIYGILAVAAVFFYNLDDATVETMRKELNDRKSQATA